MTTLNLLKTEEAMTKLATTEGITHSDIETGMNSGVQFTRKLDEPVKISMNGNEWEVTDEGLSQAAICVGIPSTYSKKCPEELLRQNLNFWYSGGGSTEKLRLFFKDQKLIGAYKNHPDYYSNIRICEDITEAIGANHIQGYHQVSTNLKYSRFSLVTDKSFDPVTGDTLFGGIAVQNSIFGQRQLQITPYIFRQVCSNGAIMSEALSQWSRRSDGKEDIDVWAKSAAQMALTGLDVEFTRIKHLTEVPVKGNVDNMMKSLFRRFQIPTRTQNLIQEEVSNSNSGQGPQTLYDVWNGLTRVATHSTDLSASAGYDLQLIAGQMVKEDNICPSCSQIL